MLDNLPSIIEAIILTMGEPVSIDRLQHILHTEEEPVTNKDIALAIENLSEHYQHRGIELIEVGSGYRFQAKADFVPWLQKCHEKKATRYSRAFLETLALIVYQQPITRGEDRRNSWGRCEHANYENITGIRMG